MVWQFVLAVEQIVTETQGLFGYEFGEQFDPFTVIDMTFAPDIAGMLVPFVKSEMGAVASSDDPVFPHEDMNSAEIRIIKTDPLLNLIEFHSLRKQVSRNRSSLQVPWVAPIFNK